MGSGVSSDGFMTTVHPAASAGPIFHDLHPKIQSSANRIRLQHSNLEKQCAQHHNVIVPWNTDLGSYVSSIFSRSLYKSNLHTHLSTDSKRLNSCHGGFEPTVVNFDRLDVQVIRDCVMIMLNSS